IAAADWVIDMGPEAGDGGGRVVVAGPPEDVIIHAARHETQQGSTGGSGAPQLRSHTGEALRAFAAAAPAVTGAAGVAPSVTTAPRGRSRRR
ncbi:MAG: hypothetical protein ACOYK7_09555, partial [Pirellulales bacterium]